MGFTMAGIAINKNFSKDKKALFHLLGIDYFVFVKESTFDEENMHISEDYSISIAYFEKGTFMSTGVTLITNNDLLSKASFNKKIIAYYINDNSNTYCFDFFENGKYVRKKWISSTDKNIDSSDNFGELLHEEKVEKDNQGIIFRIISSIIGNEFFEIEEDHPMFRYKINSPNQKVKKTTLRKRLFG